MIRLAEDLTALLREHMFVIDTTAYGSEACACGYRCDGWDGIRYEQHLAEHIVASDWLAGVREIAELDGREKGMLTPGAKWMRGKADAWDEGYRAATRGLPPAIANPHREAGQNARRA